MPPRECIDDPLDAYAVDEWLEGLEDTSREKLEIEAMMEEELSFENAILMVSDAHNPELAKIFTELTSETENQPWQAQIKIMEDWIDGGSRREAIMGLSGVSHELFCIGNDMNWLDFGADDKEKSKHK